MTSLILLILLPTQPRDPGDFNKDLQNLVISVNDLTVGDDANNTPNGVKLAVVQGVLPSPYYQLVTINPGSGGQPDSLATPILQHYLPNLDPQGNPKGPGILQSVATAVIIVNTPQSAPSAGTPAPNPEAPDPEYDSRDLKIVLSRNDVVINPVTIQFNAYSMPTPTPLSLLPEWYINESYPGFDTTANFPSTYVYVPPAPPANTLVTGITYAADGKTPTLDSLIPVVNAVLAADYTSSKPGDKTDLINRPVPLTAQQARRVADELTYVQGQNLLPLPTLTTAPSAGILEDMYTAPKTNQNNDNQNPGKPVYQSRVQFEAALKQYYAVNDAAALQLAGYILAASAAIRCEQQSLAAPTAGVTVSVEVSPPPAGTIAQTFVVVLQGTQYQVNGPTPPFGVPAAFFYALGANASVDADWTARYSAATNSSESATLSALTSARNLGIIQAQEVYTTISPPPPSPPQQPGLNVNQAARQLFALGVPVSGLMAAPLDNTISDIVTAWLQNTDTLAKIDSFWLNQATNSTTGNPAEYLNLLWLKICAEQTTLGGIIESNLNVHTASDLLGITDQTWTNFWNASINNVPNTSLLPDYTSPGTPSVRIRKFINDLRMLFKVKQEAPQNPSPPSEKWPMFQSSQQDALALFFSQALGFSFKAPLDEDAIQTVLGNLSVGPDISNWIDDALHVIAFLYQATSAGTLSSTPPSMQFSYMEALYSRGFINEQRVALLTRAQFQAALAGTVAYPVAGPIYDNATNKQPDPSPGQEPGGGFGSVNPGTLVNCCAPPNLSPFGPIEYLHEMLNLDVTAVPVGSTASTTNKLSDILSDRRGPVGNLKATMANLEYEVPMIDLVNESLENLAVASSGQVHDTPYDTIAGFDIGGDKIQIKNHVLDAIPQYSPPLIAPVTLPTIYQSLSTDCSAPILPYSLELDVNRIYLLRLNCPRFEVMRTFRQKITEFNLDPTNEPSGFLSYQWRLPVRLEIAIEYLQMPQQELQDLFLSPMTDAKLLNLYGFANDAQASAVNTVDVFTEALGLSYCEFLELTRSGIASIRNNSTDAGTFPDCPPCCLSQLSIANPSSDSNTKREALSAVAATTGEGFFTKLVLFVRLWRKLQRRYGKCCISMALLAQICQGLNWFNDNQIEPNFIRQLLALLMLCDFFCIPLHLESDAGPKLPPYKHVKLLALWTRLLVTDSYRVWAVNELLGKASRCSWPLYQCSGGEVRGTKIMASDVDEFSTLVGFTNQNPWNANPECTLRFSEILLKIISSPFSASDVEFIYTNGQNGPGDKLFPIADASEAIKDPLEHPQDDREHGLWHLRQKLLEVSVPEEEIRKWSWHRIEHNLRDKFGMQEAAGSTTDPLRALAEHLFPSRLTSPSTHTFRTSLATADTTPSMWEPPDWGPFHYDSSMQELWTALPLTDEAVLKKLAHVRQLRSTGTLGKTEQNAVRELYFAPRAMLAPFGFIFANFSEAVQVLVQSESEEHRWSYFQANFAYFYRRCEIIADHIASHVKSVGGCCDDSAHNCIDELAWKVLQSLYADENRADGKWEKDNGQLPAGNLFLWNPHSTGSAFAALLGLTGTGLVGEYKVKGSSPVAWKEVRGPIDAFGAACNAENVPVPTILPDLSYTPAASTQNDLVMFRNGFVLRDDDADVLGGASPFEVTWNGALLVHRPGDYHFEAETPCCRRESHRDDCKCGEEHLKWRLGLKRGSKSWTLLSHRWPSDEGPSHKSKAVHLLHGAYDIEISYEQDQPKYDEPEDLFRHRTGFMLKYCGPDSDFKTTPIPLDKLYVDLKDGSLASGCNFPAGNTKTFLAGQYVSSLRDIRRTYLRAFKALLFAFRFHLEAHRQEHSGGESEIGFLLDHPDRFAGTSFYQTPSSSTWNPHQVNFDFNLLPVFDTFFPPTTAPDQDDRASPSPQRTTALFDCWERVFDYKRLAKRLEEEHHERHYVPWRMFQEAVSQQPSTPDTLLRHLSIDIDLAPLCLKYFDGYSVQDSDLSDERWAVRAWRASKAVDQMRKNLYGKAYDIARPDLWASDSPDKVVDNTVTPPLSGNNNLVQLVNKACVSPDSRLWKDVRKLNDGLRERVRDAMVAYYIRLDRVKLPAGSIANHPYATCISDLSDLLLQDVSTSLCKHTARIQDGIRAAQTFMQRLQIGLEPNYVWTNDLAKEWSSNFESYESWKLYRRWQIYPENYVQVDELEKSRKCEAFRFLEERISNNELTLPKSSPGFVLVPDGLPGGETLKAKQWTDFARLSAMNNASPDDGVDLIGTPFFAQQSWLAPLNEVVPSPSTTATNPQRTDSSSTNLPTKQIPPQVKAESGPAVTAATPQVASAAPSSKDKSTAAMALAGAKSNPKHAIVAAPIQSGSDTSVDPGDNIQVPMWFKAAIRLGTRFIRIAASGLPVGKRSHIPQSDPSPHPPSARSEEDNPPHMDEYYFWLIDGRWFDGNYVQQEQVAELGVKLPDTTSDWDRPETLPGLLVWTSQPLVHLAWTRVRLGTFDPPCYSAEGVELDPSGGIPTLTFNGRIVDSLSFTIMPPDLPNYPGGSFRYDLATNFAVALPQSLTVSAPTPTLPDPLPAFPYFVYFEPGAPLAPISSFATVMSIAGALESHCHFYEALTWLRTLYDPLSRQNTLWTTCPAPSTDNGNDDNIRAISFPIITTGDPLNQYSGYVRARAVLMNFIQDLLQWAEKLMCENTSEPIGRASVLFNAAARILGPTPVTNMVKTPDQNITVTVSNFSPSKASLNPQLLHLYGRITDNQLLIQNCLSARRLSPGGWPGELVPRDKGCSCVETQHSWRASCMAGCNSCCLPYRFTIMYQKAMEDVNMVKGFSSALLAAFEKGDVEYLAALRQTHEKWLLDLNTQKMKDAYRESDWQVQALDVQIEGAISRQRYFQGLHDQGLIQGELAHIDLTNQALQSRSSANTVEATGQTMNFVPDIQIGGAGVAGSPFNANKIPLGTKLAGAFSAGARLMNTQADSQSTDAGLSATLSGWVRRDVDWQQQIEVTTVEISQLERLLHAAQRRRDMSLKDLNNHQEQLQQSADVLHFMRSKLTKQDLYLYMQQSTASLYRRSYELALQSASDAQAAFQYERRDLQSMIELPLPAWNSLREGLMAADHLEFAMHSMQRLYLKTNCREYELTKQFSLRLHFPLAFLQLRATGWCEIDVAEWMFDLDYPGHYMRRIKNVSLTIPCVTGPYVGVHCRLQQLSSGIRLTPELPGPRRSCCTSKCEDEEHAGCCCASCAPSSSSGYDDYDGLSREYVGTEAIALSAGQNDSGLFELSLHDERFVPFEFSGAVSRWKLELPRENNQFPLDTVSDVILHLNYTAREGGKVLRQAASRTAQKHLPGDGIRFFDVRHEFPEYWRSVFARDSEDVHGRERHGHDHEYGDDYDDEEDHHDYRDHRRHDYHSDPRPQGRDKHHPGRGRGDRGDEDGHRRNFPLFFTRRFFPFLPCRRPIAVVSIHVFIETERAVGECAKHFTAHWLSPKHEPCKDHWRDFVCEASADEDLCGFYHGVLDRIKLGPIGDGDERGNPRGGKPRFGYLRFPKELRHAGVRQVHFLCEYVADDGIKWCPCGEKRCVGCCDKGKCGLE